jgi:hypothetical protein
MVRRGERVQAWEVTGVAEAVDELPETHPARAALRAVVEAVRTPDAAPAAALTHLSNYARALRFDASGCWPPTSSRRCCRTPTAPRTTS